MTKHCYNCHVPSLSRDNICKNLMLCLLKNVKADPNIPDLNGNYPLHLALSNKPKVITWSKWIDFNLIPLKHMLWVTYALFQFYDMSSTLCLLCLCRKLLRLWPLTAKASASILWLDFSLAKRGRMVAGLLPDSLTSRVPYSPTSLNSLASKQPFIN